MTGIFQEDWNIPKGLLFSLPKRLLLIFEEWAQVSPPLWKRIIRTTGQKLLPTLWATYRVINFDSF